MSKISEAAPKPALSPPPAEEPAPVLRPAIEPPRAQSPAREPATAPPIREIRSEPRPTASSASPPGRLALGLTVGLVLGFGAAALMFSPGRESEKQAPDPLPSVTLQPALKVEWATRLQALGEALLDEGQPLAAERVLAEAARLSPTPAAQNALAHARDKLVEAVSGTPEEDPRRREAKRLLELGTAELRSGGRLELARTALLRAHLLGNAEAEAPLDETIRKLTLAERAAAADGATERDEGQSAQLVVEGRAGLARGALDVASSSFVRALALNPDSKDALLGLREVEQRRHEAACKQRVEAARSAAEAAFARGRSLYPGGGDPSEVSEAYFIGLLGLLRASTLAPRDAALVRRLEQVNLELAAILREGGQWDVAAVILEVSGVDPKAALVEPPVDPHLRVQEANRVAIRRAFWESRRIQPSRGFDGLRGRALGDRYRIEIRVLSDVQKGSPPRVFTTGFLVRREDTKRRTRTPWSKIDMSGPYERVVKATSSGGRVLLPFESARQAHDLPAIREATLQVEAAAVRLLAEAPWD